MQRRLSFGFWVLMVLGLAGCTVNTVVTLSVIRTEDVVFEATNGESAYRIVLTRGTLHEAAAWVTNDSGTRFDARSTTPVLDFVRSPALGFEPMTLQTDSRDIDHPLTRAGLVIASPPAGGPALHLAFTVALSDGQEVVGTVVLDLAEPVQVMFPTHIELAGTPAAIGFRFDPGVLLDGLDFDAIAGCYDDAGCRDFVLDASQRELLDIVEGNLRVAFFELDVR